METNLDLSVTVIKRDEKTEPLFSGMPNSHKIAVVMNCDGFRNTVTMTKGTARKLCAAMNGLIIGLDD